MMRSFLAALLLPGLAFAAAPPRAPALIAGPMPQFTSNASGAGDLRPAPVPNPDITAPMPPKPGSTQVRPGLLPRSGRAVAPNAASENIAQLDRKSRSAGSIGGTLAPALMVKIPLNQ